MQKSCSPRICNPRMIRLAPMLASLGHDSSSFSAPRDLKNLSGLASKALSVKNVCSFVNFAAVGTRIKGKERDDQDLISDVLEETEVDSQTLDLNVSPSSNDGTELIEDAESKSTMAVQETCVSGDKTLDPKDSDMKDGAHTLAALMLICLAFSEIKDLFKTKLNEDEAKIGDADHTIQRRDEDVDLVLNEQIFLLATYILKKLMEKQGKSVGEDDTKQEEAVNAEVNQQIGSFARYIMTQLSGMVDGDTDITKLEMEEFVGTLARYIVVVLLAWRIGKLSAMTFPFPVDSSALQIPLLFFLLKDALPTFASGTLLPELYKNAKLQSYFEKFVGKRFKAGDAEGDISKVESDFLQLKTISGRTIVPYSNLAEKNFFISDYILANVKVEVLSTDTKFVETIAMNIGTMLENHEYVLKRNYLSCVDDISKSKNLSVIKVQFIIQSSDSTEEERQISCVRMEAVKIVDKFCEEKLLDDK